MTASRSGLREQKKQATRTALREAALRLALERGPDNVRVDDIAEAAGVSPRTYNNYFSSREQAIVAAIAADRETRIAAAVAARADAGLAEAVTAAIVSQYTEPDDDARDALLLVTTQPTLRAAFVDAAAAIEPPLAAVLTERLGAAQRPTAQILAASVSAAVRVGLQRWLHPTAPSPADGLVVVAGSLPELLRAALSPLRASLEAAEQHRAR